MITHNETVWLKELIEKCRRYDIRLGQDDINRGLFGFVQRMIEAVEQQNIMILELQERIKKLETANQWGQPLTS